MVEAVNNNDLNLAPAEIEVLGVVKQFIKEYTVLGKKQKNNTWLTRVLKELIGTVGQHQGWDILSSFHGGE